MSSVAFFIVNCCDLFYIVKIFHFLQTSPVINSKYAPDNGALSAGSFKRCTAYLLFIPGIIVVVMLDCFSRLL